MRDLDCRSNLNQRPRSDARAQSRSRPPHAAVLHQFGPKGKQAALSRLGGVNRTTAGLKERTLRSFRLSQSHTVASPVHVAGLELPGTDFEMRRGALQVLLGEVDIPGTVAAVCAAPDAAKARPIHAPYDTGKAELKRESGGKSCVKPVANLSHGVYIRIYRPACQGACP